MLLRLVVYSLGALGLIAGVRACEGECIVDITHAFLGNYSAPVHQVFMQLVSLALHTV